MQGFFFGSTVLAPPRSATDLEELRLDLGVRLQHEPAVGAAVASCKFHPHPGRVKLLQCP